MSLLTFDMRHALNLTEADRQIVFFSPLAREFSSDIWVALMLVHAGHGGFVGPLNRKLVKKIKSCSIGKENRALIRYQVIGLVLDNCIALDATGGHP